MCSSTCYLGFEYMKLRCRYRPVPLVQKFVGVIEKSQAKQRDKFNQICYENCVQSLKNGNQVQLFLIN